MKTKKHTRPSMKQDQHPEHNMPIPEFNGTSPNGSPDLGNTPMDAPTTSSNYSQDMAQ
jgi:hypothetical protein